MKFTKTKKTATNTTTITTTTTASRTSYHKDDTLEDIGEIEENEVGVLENNYIEINDDDGFNSELPSLHCNYFMYKIFVL